MDDGTEIRLFDPERTPRDWTGLMRPTDCAVFLKHRTTSASLRPDGKPFGDPVHITCTVFGRLDEAQRFCKAKVEAFPHLRCEIYDAKGVSHPPLMVIVHRDHEAKEEASSFWSRRRKLIAGGLLLACVPFFWLGTRDSPASDLATLLAINCIFVAMRFLYWNAGVNHREKETRARAEAHRKMERGDA